MKTDSEYLIVLPIDPIPLGARYAKGERLPLHCTVMHWFKSETQFFGVVPWEVVRQRKDLCVGTEGIQLVSGAKENFGVNGEVVVNVLERNPILNVLHTLLLVHLVAHDFWPQKLQWVGAGYRPHVTPVHGRSFPSGTTYHAREMVLIERTSDKSKRVIAVSP